MAASPDATLARIASVDGPNSGKPQNEHVYKHSESVASYFSGSSASSDENPSAQRLVVETITDWEAKKIMASIKAVAVLCSAGILVFAVLKSVPEATTYFVLNRDYHVASLALGAACLASLVAVSTFYVARVSASLRAGRVWTPRRVRPAVMTAVRVSTMLVVTGTYTATHAVVLADPGAFCSVRLVGALGAVRWIGWNTMLLCMVIDAHCLVPLRGAGGRIDGSVQELGWKRHWKKLLLWTVFTAVVLWLEVIGVTVDKVIVIEAGPEGCVWGAPVECHVPDAILATMALKLAVIVTYAALYMRYTVAAWRGLRAELYQRFRLWNLLWRIQVRVKAVVLAIFTLGMCVLWFLGINACVNYAVTWLGIMPLILVMTAYQLISLHLTMARPQGHTHDVTGCASIVQTFAWTERSLPRKLAERAAAADAVLVSGRGTPSPARACALRASIPRPRCREGGQSREGSSSDSVASTNTSAAASAPASVSGSATSVSLEGIHSEPMFCFETCIKLFFWAALVYGYTEAEGAELSSLPEAIRALVSEIGVAMRLFGLTRRRLFYDRRRGTKVLVAWNESTVLVTVRGSAEAANFFEDAKFLQVVHPPRRKGPGGRVPRVHRGFLATWAANGIGAAVLSHVGALVASAADPSSVRILVTGHSLGGAVAQLAALDVARALRLQPRQLTVYTFGCPRIGNHALAAEYVAAVPDTWHIINGYDIVTQGMKLFGAYKRAGTRVIVTTKGDIIVRPTLFELSLLQNPFGGTVAHHYTPAYQASLVAIITAQLDATRSHADGLEGLLALLKDVPIVRTALEAHAARATGGGTLVDTIRELGAAALRSSSSRRLSTSHVLPPSQGRDSLRGSAGDAGLAALLAAGGRGDGEAPASAVVPVAQWQDLDAAVDGSSIAELAESLPGQEDREASTQSSGDSLERSEASTPANMRGLCNLEAAAAVAALGRRPCRHTSGARLVTRWLWGRTRPGDGAPRGAEGGEAGAAGEGGHKGSTVAARDSAVAVELGELCRPHARCYAILEEEDGGQGAGGAASEHWKKLRRWKCPLSAAKAELPPNARLRGCLLDIGAVPDMRHCRGAGSHAARGPSDADQLRLRMDSEGASELPAAPGPMVSAAPGTGERGGGVPAAEHNSSSGASGHPVRMGMDALGRESSGGTGRPVRLPPPPQAARGRRLSSPGHPAAPAGGPSRFSSPAATAGLCTTLSSSILSTQDLLPPRVVPQPHPDVPQLDIGLVGGYQETPPPVSLDESIEWPPTASTAAAARDTAAAEGSGLADEDAPGGEAPGFATPLGKALPARQAVAGGGSGENQRAPWEGGAAEARGPGGKGPAEPQRAREGGVITEGLSRADGSRGGVPAAESDSEALFSTAVSDAASV